MKFNLKSFLSIMAYVAVVAVGVALLLQALLKGEQVAGIIKLVADVIAYLMLVIYSFAYAKSRRSVVFVIVWIIAVVLIVISYII